MPEAAAIPSEELPLPDATIKARPFGELERDAVPVRPLVAADTPAVPATAEPPVAAAAKPEDDFFCSGVVVDEEGNPVKAIVSCFALPPGADPAKTNRAQRVWIPTLSAGSKLAAEFRVRGTTDEPQVWIEARPIADLGAPTSEPRLVARGTTGLRLVVPAGAILEWQLALDPEVDPSRLQVTITQESRDPPDGLPPELLSTGSIGIFERKGQRDTYRIACARSGVLSMTCLIVGTSVPPVAVRDIRVDTGRVTRDPRLWPWDLRRSLAKLSIDIRNLAHEPIAGAEVRILNGAASTVEGISVATEGTANLLVTKDPVDVEVRAEGYRTATVRGITSNRTIALREGLRVRVQIAGLTPSLDDDVEFRLQLRQRSAGEPGRVTSRMWIDERGRQAMYSFGPIDQVDPRSKGTKLDDDHAAVSSLSEAGSWTVGLIARIGTVSKTFDLGAIAVEERDADRTFVVNAPARPEIESAITELRKAHQQAAPAKPQRR